MFGFLERFPLGSVNDHLPGRSPILVVLVVMHFLDDLVSAGNFACTSVVPSHVSVAVNTEFEVEPSIGKIVLNAIGGKFILPQLRCVPIVRCLDFYFPKIIRVEREHFIALGPGVSMRWDIDEQAGFVMVPAVASHEHLRLEGGWSFMLCVGQILRRLDV